MAQEVDLEYAETSFVGPFDESTLRDFEDWLKRNSYFGGRMHFDPAYVAHLRKFHGGVPKKRCFKTVNGTEKLIECFQHFATLPPESPLRDAGVKRSWSLTCDRLGDVLMPFADLFAGDMLCFDYSRPGRPKIVVWFHEESPPDEPPHTEFVAENFDEFLPMLYELPVDSSQSRKPSRKRRRR